MTVPSLRLCFGVHNHQPAGNFDHVVAEAVERAYRPFLDRLWARPEVRATVHFTGALLEWVRERAPATFDRLGGLVARGQVELLTGGYFEPILAVVPDHDKVGQIERLTAFIKDHFGVRPRGLWLAERVWEPSLPRPLRQAGVEYVLVDDRHFALAGLDPDALGGWYLTEEQGCVVGVVPISQPLRYRIPFAAPEATVDYLAARRGRVPAVTVVDDGEKFGVWPGPHRHVYEEGWLDRLFDRLLDLGWLRLATLGEMVDAEPAAGRVYLPTASYREMMEWALPAHVIHEYEDFEHKLAQAQLLERYKIFVRGGFWRNFFAKYPEANHMHKRMLRVSNRVARLARHHHGRTLPQARDHLWAAQCNCPYWHGVFGGLYLNNLRAAIYRELITAERLLDKVEHPHGAEKWAEAEVIDFDADGAQEVIVETERFNLYVAPERGGVLTELDFKPKAVNLLDTLARREEGYHRKLAKAAANVGQPSGGGSVASIHDLVLVKEQGLERRLHSDRYEHKSLVDHFLGEETTVEELASAQYEECGDFVGAPYEFAVARPRGAVEVVLRRSGRVKVQSKTYRLELTKRLVARAGSERLVVSYELRNMESQPLRCWFGVECNVALQAGQAPDRYFTFDGAKPDDPHLASLGQVDKVRQVAAIDEWRKLRVSFTLDRAATVCRFPVETISQSEGGFERVYQSSAVVPLWHLVVDPGQTWHTQVEIACEEFGP